MELLDKGKHCEEEYCRQLDYLPFKCNACSKYYCVSHIKHDDHACKDSHKLNYEIPSCPLCSKTVVFTRGEDLDLCLAKHVKECETQIRSDSENKTTNQSKDSNHTKKCAFDKCKTKDSLRFECNKCNKNFCIKHRIQEDHCCLINYRNCSQQANANKIKNIFYSVKNFWFIFTKL